MYQEIFKQGKIGNITLKNRLVMSPMGTSLAEMDGSPSEDMIAFYEARAIGGAALIIPEIARVNDLHGAGMMRQLSVSKDRHIEGLAKLAETVHKYGTKIFIQLHHPGRETVTALTAVNHTVLYFSMRLRKHIRMCLTYCYRYWMMAVSQILRDVQLTLRIQFLS